MHYIEKSYIIRNNWILWCCNYTVMQQQKNPERNIERLTGNKNPSSLNLIQSK